MQTLVRLDYDSYTELRAGIERLRFVRDVVCANGFNPGRVVLRRYRTRRGYHVELLSRLALEPVAMVALQAILGSDYRREAFNLFRALALPSAPVFWRKLGHWNVLHRGRLWQESSK